MLVLTRKKNDSIVIDGRILVEVLQIRGSGIRLGISAPPDVSILRGELKPFGVETGSGVGSDDYQSLRQNTQSHETFSSESLAGISTQNLQGENRPADPNPSGYVPPLARLTRRQITIPTPRNSEN